MTMYRCPEPGCPCRWSRPDGTCPDPDHVPVPVQTAERFDPAGKALAAYQARLARRLPSGLTAVRVSLDVNGAVHISATAAVTVDGAVLQVGALLCRRAVARQHPADGPVSCVSCRAVLARNWA